MRGLQDLENSPAMALLAAVPDSELARAAVTDGVSNGLDEILTKKNAIFKGIAQQKGITLASPKITGPGSVVGETTFDLTVEFLELDTGFQVKYSVFVENMNDVNKCGFVKDGVGGVNGETEVEVSCCGEGSETIGDYATYQFKAELTGKILGVGFELKDFDDKDTIEVLVDIEPVD